MSTELQFVWYDPDRGTSKVIGKCVVEDDGSLTTHIDDELLAEALTESVEPISFSIIEDKKVEDHETQAQDHNPASGDGGSTSYHVRSRELGFG